MHYQNSVNLINLKDLKLYIHVFLILLKYAPELKKIEEKKTISYVFR